MLRVSERARKWKQRYEQKRGRGKAMSVLAAKLGRAVYHMLRKGEDFDEERFWNGRDRSAGKVAPAGKSTDKSTGKSARKPVRKSAAKTGVGCA